jgi:hypothetical protein
VIEIDITPSKIDRPGIYSKLRIPEVWRFKDDTVSIKQPAAGGKFLQASQADSCTCVPTKSHGG